MALLKTGNAEKRKKRAEKAAKGERLTNGYMLCLTYGLAAIILLEIVRRQYLVFVNSFDQAALDFANMFCIVCGVVFAVGAAGVAIFGCFRKISGGKMRTYTITFAVASIVSFFLSWDVRLPISQKMLASKENWGVFDFLANLKLYDDAKYIEFGIIGFLVVSFVIYAIRLARLEKNGK